MDCSLPGSSVHGVLQTRVLEWVVIFSSRGSSQPRDRTCISCIGRWILYHWTTREALWPSSGYLNENKNAHRCKMLVSLCHLLGHWTQGWLVSHMTFPLPCSRLHHTRILLPSSIMPEASSRGSNLRNLTQGIKCRQHIKVNTFIEDFGFQSEA